MQFEIYLVAKAKDEKPDEIKSGPQQGEGQGELEPPLPPTSPFPEFLEVKNNEPKNIELQQI